MDQKIKIRAGDIILNKESNCIFLITKAERNKIAVHQTRKEYKALTFEMTRAKLIEQLTSERGKEVLIYYNVKV